MASYEKPTDYWCEISCRDEKGEVKEPVGFCEFCDRNNETWYIPNMKCHATMVEKASITNPPYTVKDFTRN